MLSENCSAYAVHWIISRQQNALPKQEYKSFMFTTITQHAFLSHCFAGVITVNGTESYAGVYRCTHAASKGTTLGSNIEWNIARGCWSWRLLTHSKHSDYMHMQLLFKKGHVMDWQNSVHSLSIQFHLQFSKFHSLPKVCIHTLFTQLLDQAATSRQNMEVQVGFGSGDMPA